MALDISSSLYLLDASLTPATLVRSRLHVSFMRLRITLGASDEVLELFLQSQMRLTIFQCMPNFDFVVWNAA